MIKEGDKVICINDFECLGYRSTLYYKEGKIYEIKRIDTKVVYIISDDGADGVWFRIIKDGIKFGDSFILLAEYREQQMKSILDD